MDTAGFQIPSEVTKERAADVNTRQREGSDSEEIETLENCDATMPGKMQDVNNKVTSKDSPKSEGLDLGPCHQHFETLSRDAVPLRSRIGLALLGGYHLRTKE